MTAVRGKFRCATLATSKWSTEAPTQRTYTFQALYDTSIPEDQKYAKATPTGTLTMTVDNEAVVFTLGGAYYLDITPADN